MGRSKTFCGFSMGRNQYWAGRVYDLCVYYMTGTPEGSTESGFMEKPGIEPATPGLQGIALIHYTTGASWGGNQTKVEEEGIIQLTKLRQCFPRLDWFPSLIKLHFRYAYKLLKGENQSIPRLYSMSRDTKSLNQPKPTNWYPLIRCV